MPHTSLYQNGSSRPPVDVSRYFQMHIMMASITPDLPSPRVTPDNGTPFAFRLALTSELKELDS